MTTTSPIIAAGILSLAAGLGSGDALPTNDVAAVRIELEARLDRLRPAVLEGATADNQRFAQWYNWPNWLNGWNDWPNWRNW